MIQNIRTKEDTLKDQLLNSLRPVMVGAALLLGFEKEGLAQTNKPAATATKNPKTPSPAAANGSVTNQEAESKSANKRYIAAAAHIPDFGVTDAAARLREAQKGSPQAMYDVGRALQFGRGVPLDLQGAQKWYRLAIEKGHVLAKCALADWLLCHEGEKKPSCEEALSLFTSASKEGSSLASSRLAYLHLHGFICKRDPQRAVELFEVAISQGCTESPLTLSQLLRVGTPGLEPDNSKALKILQAAAVKGSPDLKLALVEAYLDEKRFADALPLAEEAAAAKVPGASHALACLLLTGEGGKKDTDRAMELLNSGGELSSPLASFTTATTLLEKNPSPEGQKLAVKLLRDSAKNDFTLAQHVLGTLLCVDAPGLQRPLEGMALLREAATKDFGPSIATLGARLASSESAREQAEGITLLTKGASQGYAPCDLLLGQVYLNQSRSTEAVVYLKRAAAKGLSDAKGILALNDIWEHQTGDLPPVSKAAKEAADAGSAYGYMAYGLSRGPGVKTMFEQRQHELHWVEKAANAGVPRAQAYLGQMYLEAANSKFKAANNQRTQPNRDPKYKLDLPVAKSPELTAAVKWLSLAGAQGVSFAADIVNRIPANLRDEAAATKAVREFEPTPSQAENEISALEREAAVKCIENFSKPLKDLLTFGDDAIAMYAKYNSPEHALELADYISTGLAGKKNPAASKKLITEAAVRGFAPAQATLAERYYRGDMEFPLDLKNAAFWAEAAAKKGDANGQYLYGLLVTKKESGLSPNAARSTEMLSKAADQGHPRAAHYLAMQTDSDASRAENEKTRTAYLRKASDAGIKAAQLALLDHLIVTEDSGVTVPAEARAIIDLLALHDQGMHSLAKGLLARLEKDYDAAIDLLSADSLKTNECANLALAMLHDDTLGAEKRSTFAKLRALKYYETAANLGSLEALTRIGILCERGLTGAGDEALALDYHRKAAERGSVRSNYRLAIMLSQENAPKATLPEAHARLSIAATQGNQAAKTQLVALEARLSQEQRVESSKIVQQIGLERFKRPATSGIGKLVYTAGTEGR